MSDGELPALDRIGLLDYLDTWIDYCQDNDNDDHEMWSEAQLAVLTTIRNRINDGTFDA